MKSKNPLSIYTFSKWGSLEGILEVIGNNQLVICDPLYGSKIKCTNRNKAEIYSISSEFIGDRVEAEGMIKYSYSGFPIEIQIQRMIPLNPDSEMINYIKSVVDMFNPFS